MNLLLVTQDYPPKLGGIEIYSHKLAEEWTKMGIKVTVLTVSLKSTIDQEEGFDQKQNFEIIRLKVSNPIMLAVALKSRIGGIIEEYNIDSVFHSQWLTAVTSCKMMSQNKIKNVFVAIHGRELVFNPYEKIPVVSEIYRSKMRYVFEHCTHIFSNSRYTANQLHKLNLEIDPSTKTTVTSLGVESSLLQEVPKAEALANLGLDSTLASKFIVLNFARLVERKGADITLKALQSIKESHPEIPFLFLIAGNGPFLNKLTALVKQLEMENDVHFLGSLNRDQIHNLYSASDVYVMVSRTTKTDFEGFGIVYLEAGLFGVPSIGGNGAGVPDAIIHEETGFLVEEENVEELADKLLLLFTNKSLAKRMGKKAQERVKHLSWKRVSSLIYNKMIELDENLS